MPASEWARHDGCRVRIESDVSVAYRGEKLAGRVCLEAVSQRRAVLPRVSVWIWRGYTGSDSYSLPTHELAENLELFAGVRCTLPFALVVPGGPWLFPTYVALATDDPPSAPFGSPRLSLPTWPELKFVALAQQLGAVSAHEISHWSDAGGGDGVYAHLNPRPEMRPLFDGLGLELYSEGACIYGTLVVDPQERTLTDVLRAAAGTDIRRYRIRFSNSQLPYADKEFERLLRPFMAQDRHLPIPAAGEDQDVLPRASHPPAPNPTGLPVPDPASHSSER